MVAIPVTIQFNGFLPVYIIDYAAIVVVIIVALGIIYKFRAWLRTVPPGFFHEASTLLGSSRVVSDFFYELGNRVVAQKKVITDSKSRWLTHFLVFWGFIGLAIATVWDDIFFRNGTLPPPFSFANPGNVIGNVAGAMALVGASIIAGRYLFVEKFKNAGRGDMVFFFVLYLAIITGFLTEFMRFAGAQFPTLVTYSIHLVVVGALLVTAPFTHFFHAILTPFMRFIERLRSGIQSKKGPFYSGDRYSEMTKTSELVKSGQEKPLVPDWLKEARSSDATDSE